MERPLIIALDFSNMDETKTFLHTFKNEELFLKVGMELFYEEGPEIIKLLKHQGHSIFLDLKLHDIPNTVNRAMSRLAKLGCDLVNVHAAGGIDMMKAAIDGLDAGTLAGKERPKCIAVTQLTSTSESQMKAEQLIPVTLSQSVMHYATLSKEAGVDGVVCSAHEVADLRSSFGEEFLTVVPGIRLSDSSVQDQVRVASPCFAREAGVSAIVVGRPITRSTDPLRAYEIFQQEWRG
ncbi:MULTISPECIES: orotidine-5'-phosphate decarboxylase [unclassified Bacillus (in: firmicutes)]|uniref:orotidine-5'-phosphate decarboxylase n=1 Tax=unclassified Bacillus (in: firmicutes) TaxID=185979 RepID=UPI0008E2ECEE|nr:MULTISPECIES: orotidine-5'-phosphate decarboxylase [unclassified Bacillus (in: firmicutes)]SFA75028.1 orotidine-5'-phosphate decarboxylase [Bacillus sp. UNCCL13]SFQ65154.1 orotidine-5'-phosphate decarboxylase [Bacillus sp. cl95]